MKISSLKSLTLALVAGTALTLTTPARAQDINSFFSVGDIMMGFKATGGTGSDTQVYVALDLATDFRDATGNFLNIRNVGSLLTTTYGASWWERDDLSFGVAGVLSNLSAGGSVVNGDPARTIYISRARTEPGTIGLASSTAWTVASNTAQTTASTAILSMSTRFANDFTTASASLPATNVNSWASNTAGSTDFGAFNGGVETTFGSGSFGTVGEAGNVEGAVDLYRVLATTTGASPSGTVRTGSYEGTFTVNSSGDISFVAVVPEPSQVVFVIALVAGVVATAVVRRRRNANA